MYNDYEDESLYIVHRTKKPLREFYFLRRKPNYIATFFVLKTSPKLVTTDLYINIRLPHSIRNDVFPSNLLSKQKPE